MINNTKNTENTAFHILQIKFLKIEKKYEYRKHCIFSIFCSKFEIHI